MLLKILYSPFAAAITVCSSVPDVIPAIRTKKNNLAILFRINHVFAALKKKLADNRQRATQAQIDNLLP